MSTNQHLYRELRQGLLRSAKHHRRAAGHPHLARDLHDSHLHTVQRKLGALRQAYRRTQEAIAWEHYRRSVER